MIYIYLLWYQKYNVLPQVLPDEHMPANIHALHTETLSQKEF